MNYNTNPQQNPAEDYVLAEPAVAYGAERETAEPWVAVAVGYGDGYFDDDEPLPEGWEDELLNDPAIIAEIEQRMDECDAEEAAGTAVTYSTEEVLAYLKQEFPRLWGFSNV